MSTWLSDNRSLLVVALLVVLVTALLLWRLAGTTSKDTLASQAPASVVPTAGKKTLTKKEIGRHQTSDDCWIILESREHGGKARVYDVTAYMEDHPGGQAILNNAGGNSTKGFYGPQHPARVFDMIEDFYIGDLET